MEIENKKFRCHGSIVLEQCAKVIGGIVFFGLVNFSDLLTKDFDAKSDGLIFGLIFTGILAAILIVVLTFSIIRWRKTTIVIEEDAIVWEKNTLNRKTLTISIKSISSINIERNIFERIIGTAKLKLDTSSLSTADITDVLFIFKHEDAISYKEYLEEKVRGADAESYINDVTEQNAVAENIPKSEQGQENEATVQYVSSPMEIIMHCIYDMSVIAVLVGLGVTVLGIVEMVDTIRNGIAGIGGFFATLVIIFTFGSGTVKSLVGKFFQFYNLTVSAKGNRIYMKYGLFKLKEYVIPVEKINAIHIKQNWIGRLFHRYSVSMECVGVGNEENETAQLTLALPYDEVIRRLSLLLPGYEVEQLAGMKNISKKAVYHKIKRIIIFTFFVVGVAVGARIAVAEIEPGKIEWPVYAIAVAVILFLYVLIVIGILLQLKTEATGFGETHMFITNGTLSKDTMVVPYKKIQYVTLQKSPISKYSGLTWGHINILAGVLSTVKILPCIQMEEGEIIKEKIMWKSLK